MTDVFISYARSTEAVAEQVAAGLRAAGYVVWRDDALAAHRAYSDEIAEQLDAAKAVVVLWSNDAARSQWVRSEADRARQADKLVQLSLEPTRLPMPFDQVQCADLRGWAGEAQHPGWRAILDSVGHLIGGKGERPASTANPPAAAPASAQPLLAVLAFDNLAGDEETAAFSDGVSQEILDTVARTAALRVIGRASSFSLRGADKTPRSVAATLGASHVLDGSVRRAGARLRVSAELCDCPAGRSLWSERFDRDLSDVFAVQDEIAAAVAVALKLVFEPPERANGGVDPRAYELYLDSRDQQRRSTYAEKAALADRAVALAPDFAAAWGWLAHLRAKVAVFERGAAPFAPLADRARKAIARALALDPASALPKAAEAQLQPFAAYARREALIDEALAAAPSDPTMLLEKSSLLSAVGRMSDALAAARLALAMDPTALNAAGRVANVLVVMGDWSAGQAACDDLRRRWPDAPSSVTLAAPAAAFAGDWAKLDELVAHAAARDYGPRAGDVATNLMFAQALRSNDGGFASLAQSVADAELARDGWAGLEKLFALSALGRTDAAFDLAERSHFTALFEPGAFTQPGGYNMDFLCAPTNNGAMIADPRFPALCKKLGLTRYWLARDRWPDCADQTPYDFRAEVRLLGG